jgi:hypothetical protein
MVASSTPFTVSVEVGNGSALLDIENTAYPVMTPGQLYISEANPYPASGRSQWLEITNTTAQSFDLGGWTLDFGNNYKHVIAGPLVVPAKGTVLLGQDSNSAEASSGGPAVDYVYGSAFNMQPASSSVVLSLLGGTYQTFTWGSVPQGTSIQEDSPGLGLKFASGLNGSYCQATSSYGASGQKGTPRAANSSCFPWRLSQITGAFQPIATTGQLVPGFSSTTSGSIDTNSQNMTFATLGGRAVKIGSTLYSTSANGIRINANGYVALTTDAPSSSNTALSVPSTVASSPKGIMAPFWANLGNNANSPTSPSGVYWQQFDPDGMPGSGDEYTLISWENWKFQGSGTFNLNFQIKFIEGTGDVEYHYGTMTGLSSIFSAGYANTEWFESLDGTVAMPVVPQISTGTGYHFTYTP